MKPLQTGTEKAGITGTAPVIDVVSIAADDPFAQRRRSSLLSRLASLLIGTFMTGLGIWLLASGLDLPIGAALVATGLFRFPVIWIEARGYATTSALIANFTAAILLAAAVVDNGAFAGLEVWVPVMITMPLLIMGPQHGRLRTIVPVVNIAIVATAEAVAYRLPPFHQLPAELLAPVRFANVAGAAIMMAVMVGANRRLLDRAERRVAEEQHRSERLLANILPGPIARRLKRGENPIADGHPAATIMFADIVNFTGLAAAMPADAVVTLLNRLFQAFDDMVDRSGLEKIKTIGDAYMVAGGLDDDRNGAAAVAELAIEMLAFVRDLRGEAGRAIDLRIGIHTGPLVAGVIGKRKFSYDVWGDTVNTASRLADASDPGRILVSAATVAVLGPSWRIEARGPLALKGLGKVPAYFLLGSAATEPSLALREMVPEGGA